MSAPEPEAPFAEPWQAEAFALTVHLHAAGHFSWPDWSAALGAERARPGPDDPGRYWRDWLAALEGLLRARGLAGEDALSPLRAAWAEAYATTPHGEPVTPEPAAVAAALATD
ncbi:MAG: nitrile hydratase accessory protein [Pseudomonadota bacterium]